MTQAVILAGGKGTRLASRLNGKPKPLVDVAGIPLLKRQIDVLVRNGIDDIVLLVSHAADQIEAFLAREAFACRITLIDDGDPRGTAGATLACLDRLDDRFVVVYGDTLFDLDLAHMLEAHGAAGGAATLLLHPNDHPADSDLVEVSRDGWIERFHPYPHPPGTFLRNLVNAAFYIVERAALEPWASRMPLGDFARDLFPAMLEGGAKLRGYVSYEYIKDIGTPPRLDKAERQLTSGMVARAMRDRPQKAVFVDRDGTLNEPHGHIARVADLTLYPFAGAALKRLNESEYRVVVITNQPVLARGECDEKSLAEIHAKLESNLGDDGAFIDALYYCPHHPDGGYAGEVPELKRPCPCRKPGTAMLERAAADLNIILSQSWMIGDSSADIAMANRAGVRSILVNTGEGGKDGKFAMTPDHIADTIADAVDLIVAPRI